MTNPITDASRLINKRQLLEIVPITYSSIWDLMRTGQFPLSVRIGSRVYWRVQEIEQWLAALPRSKYAGKSLPRKTLTEPAGDVPAADPDHNAVSLPAPKQR